jgi:serine/threonine-protein kinase RsbW
MGVARSKRRHSPEPPSGRPPQTPARPHSAVVNSHSLKFTIDSDFDQGREVQSQIIQRIEQSGFSEHNLFAIKLALEEALINAIKHGNKLDPNKKVHIEARIDSTRAQITIEDQGPGFDRKSVPDPTADENLCKCSGRGILLIEAYMSSVKWSKNGRRVTLIKNNDREAHKQHKQQKQSRQKQ